MTGIGIRAFRLRAQRRHSGRKEPIALTVAPDLLAKVDEIAKRMSHSRAALTNRATDELAEQAIS